MAHNVALPKHRYVWVDDAFVAEALWGKRGDYVDDHNAVDAHWLADYARKVVLPTMGTDE